MHSFRFTKALAALAVAMTFGALTACDDEPVVSAPPEENTIPGQEVGVKRLKVSLPRLSRFDNVIDHVSCRIHLRGRADRVTYPVNTFISADKDSIYIEADDPILSELPHQLYNLNALTFPRKNMTARSEDALAEDTVYVGARLSLEDPNNIRFRSSFNVGANSIGAGTEEDPWIIASGDDFMTRVSDPMTRGETHEGKYFEITRNINLNTAYVTAGKGWEPAGHNNINGGSTDFNGTINGCDNYIENLYCFTDAGYGGLFYRLGEKSYIHNLEMCRVMLSGSSDLGAFACYSDAGCRLDSIAVSGTIEGNGDNIGGLVGKGDVAVRYCISSVNISSTSDKENKHIGGMVGFTQHSSFSDCIRNGKIDAPKAVGVGGYVGSDATGKGGTSNTLSSYTRCYSCGIITGGSYVGGFSGDTRTEFTDCHAGATLPMDSYAYTTQWDIFGFNTRMTPMPLEVRANERNAGGFVGSSPHLTIHGENSFAYSSPAKPNIVSPGPEVGGLAGICSYYGAADGKFTSNAYVQGDTYTGGVIGYAKIFAKGGTFVNNGNVIGAGNTGGIMGIASILADGVKINFDCKNTGNVKGAHFVGGIFGQADIIKGALLENEGNVEGTETVGGLIGESNYINLRQGSHVGSENGSLKITGGSEVGGICGSIAAELLSAGLIESYCPVYANIISSAGTVGGLVGLVNIHGSRTTGYSLFWTHYPVRVSITVTGGDFAGGAIGKLQSTCSGRITIYDLGDNLQGSITTAGSFAGGLIGYIEHKSDVTIERCHNFVSITSTAPKNIAAFGGIVGCELAKTEKPLTLSIAYCSNHGDLNTPVANSTGGIIGHAELIYVNQNFQMHHCYNAGRIDADYAVGGIVGCLMGPGTISNCFNMGEVPSVSGRKYLAGIIGMHDLYASRRLNIEYCYNVGQTGWGIIGGEPKNKYSIKRTFYLDSASNGDMEDSGSIGVSADRMRNEWTYQDWSYQDWDFHDGEAAPTLKDVPMFNEKLPLQK